MKVYQRRVMSLNKKGPYQGFSYKKKRKIAKRGGGGNKRFNKGE